ncbi:Zinc transporter ZIP12 [Holothuria leucospilota]|uniref:Zinc transporter ZIP12 n=1 Tax=Holothuria leucospilota TaxID=206669 RepID=A0A9Q1C0C0_HOLLE|nr:Zinc transporter ZIP12 [Holothuria leucospilota]
MKLKVALFWNFVSSLFAFLGLYVGVNLALSETIHHWIFAVTAGLFLYISLVDLVSTVKSGLFCRCMSGNHC